MRKALFLATMVFCITVTFATLAHATQKGSKASNFTLMDLEGNEVSLKQFEGKPVVLNFWATWCPPCRNEMPEFNELDKQFKETKEAVLLMVNMTDGRRETKATVQNFIKKEQIRHESTFGYRGNSFSAIQHSLFADDIHHKF